MKLFTFKWSCKRKKNDLVVVIKALDRNGKPRVLRKTYREWLGVATNNIKSIVRRLKRQLPKCRVEYVKLDDREYETILPLFYDKIKRNDYTVETKSFYKLYVDANVADIGDFLDSDDVSYYAADDWLNRIYIDLCTKFQNSERFYYSWYEIDLEERDLVASFKALYDQDSSLPPITVASFDLETVPWEVGESRLPSGHNRGDVIVMISLVLGHVSPSGKVTLGERYLFYLNPISEPLHGLGYREHFTEIDLLRDFFKVLGDSNALILTGYNVNNFDFPCLFARLVFLNAEDLIRDFSSRSMGKHLVTTFKKKDVVDVYNYAVNFSPGGLVSFKLDDVAKARLGDSKVPIRATGIHHWYQSRDRLTPEVLMSDSVQECYDVVRPGFDVSVFGTFRTCLEYCLKDSELVLRLVDKESVLSFLMARANMSSMSLEQVLYYGNSRYIRCVFETYGTMMGYFVNFERMRNVVEDDGTRYLDHAVPKRGKKYQGALNHCRDQVFCRNVTVYDFESLYPSVIICGNISYETFAVLRTENVTREVTEKCACVPFRVHGTEDFETPREVGAKFSFPTTLDQPLTMVSFKGKRGFLPSVMMRLRERRRVEKALAKASSANAIYHNNRQLSFKLVMNSIYGLLGSDEGRLASLALAMSTTDLSRETLLGAFHRALSLGFRVVYADTDSLFVEGGELINALINEYLDLESINLQYETTHPYMLILTKKKYCYETARGEIRTKGFEIKSNQLTKDMVARALREAFAALKSDRGADVSAGWCLLVELLMQAFVASRSPHLNCMTRKVRALSDYSPRSTAPHVRLLKRQAATNAPYISFTYVYTDLPKETDDRLNPMFVEDVRDPVNFEKLYVSQKANILALLNAGFFRLDNVKRLTKEYNALVQLVRWRQVVNAAVLYRHRTGNDLVVLVEKSVKYSFKIV